MKRVNTLMLKKERVDYILRTLKQRYPKPAIPLQHRDTYTLLVAVLLSAQCTDERVNKITPQLWQLANSALAMSQCSAEQVKAIIRPCGLSPKKSKAIVKLSQILVEKYHGEVPKNIDDLEGLPGVGHKTASVVMSQAFGEPMFPVDTHIHRLAQRWGLTNGKNVSQTERDLKHLFPRECWNNLHLQIIYYGREFCTARGCDGRVCEMCRTCYPNRKSPKVAKKA